MSEDERKLVANIAPFGLRMQPGLKAKIERAAQANNRSMNAEIIARLERDLEKDEFEKVVLRIPEDLLYRIWEVANLEDMDVNYLIVEKLEAAFPPPTMSLGQIVERIRFGLEHGKVIDERHRRELTEYLRGAEALILAEPEFKNVTITIPRERG